MKKNTVKCIAASLAALSCMYVVPQKVMAYTTDVYLNDSSSYTAHKDKKDKCKEEEKKKDDCKCKDEKKDKDKNKDKCKEEEKDKSKSKPKDNKSSYKGLELFTEENCKFLSPEQKKTLEECKQCKEKGTEFTEDQKKSIIIMIDCIVKGKLGDEKYKDFKCLTEKETKGTKLTEEESKKLKEYKTIIEGKDKTSATDILKQFLR
ncbi:MAG: hypothetical protein ACI398_02200 [Clostridium sp.]